MTEEPERVQLTVVTQEIEDSNDPPAALDRDGASAGGGESSEGEGDIEIEHVGDESSLGGVHGLLPTITFDARRRTLINIYQRTILEEFYRCGMTSASVMLNHLHTAAAEKTGLTVTVVKMSSSEGERCKYVSTRKGGNALMHNGYAYYKVRNGENGRVFWKCVKLDCKARISTVNDYIASCRHEHNHLTEEEENKNWIRNRRRPAAVKSAERFAEKIAHGNLPPVPTIPNVPSLASIGLPTSSLTTEPVSSFTSSNTPSNPVGSLVSHLLPDRKRICTESSLSISTSVAASLQSQQVPSLQPVVSIHHSPLTTPHQPHPPFAPPPQPIPTCNTSSSTSSGHSGGRSSSSSGGGDSKISDANNGSTNENPLLVKVRVSGSGESDFVEVEVPSLSYSSLLKSCSEELEVATHEIAKIRKLPNVWVRKDKDVQRMKEGQELEVIIKSGSATVSIAPQPPVTTMLTVNPLSVSSGANALSLLTSVAAASSQQHNSISHSSASAPHPPITTMLTVNPLSASSGTNNAFSLLTSAAVASSQQHSSAGHGLGLRSVENDNGLLAALTNDGPVSMPELTNVGRASNNSSHVNGLH